MAELEELSPEEIDEKDKFDKEEIEDVEGRITDFFMGLFGRKKKEKPVDEDVDNNNTVDDEDDFIEDDSGDGNPFVRDSKLYGQDYNKLKSKYQSAGQLFRDKRFPPVSSSLFYSSPAPNIEWRRPGQLCQHPRMVVDGVDRFDINQGELGDCWLLAAMSSMAMDKDLLYQVMPKDQSFDEDYVGMFKFRFWQYGEWVEVVVDDYLPCIDGKLVYIHSDSKNEFWSPLFEKAYAKLHGSYQALKGGSTCEAMVDFTGGCSEIFDLTRPVPKDLFSIMEKAYQRKSLNCSSIAPDPFKFEAKTDVGLIKGHAYSITKVVKAKIATSRVRGLIPLVRVRNPWGNETEWKGTWNDGAEEWGFIAEEEKERLGIYFEHDGEWWMSHKDFVKHFDQLEICNVSPEIMEDCEQEATRWHVNQWDGEWIGGETAGGCRNYLETFVHNPQSFVTLSVPDDDEDNLCTLIVSLMQKDRRALKHEGVGMLSIGFVIYKVKNADQGSAQLGEDFFKYTLSTARSKSFINMREVTGRFKLPTGTYVIVPSTYDPGYEGLFLLRTFTEKQN
eukprot:GFUD01016393.1.p1 GENE.GFUD01016393.1~~GFUD01016393.1.p1  ORF type:complete len:558 (+),score=172.85 GFUD01016393.1:52-1725(+)